MASINKHRKVQPISAPIGNKRRKGLLLINVGTPQSPSTRDVKAYLKRFLNDPYVIDMPKLLRHILVNGIIVPFRAPHSAKRYQKLWTTQGSPLLVHLLHLQKKLQSKMAEDCQVFAAMNYGQPQLSTVIKEIKAAHIEELTVLPLYPHYAKSTTLSAQAAFEHYWDKWQACQYRFIDAFHNHPAFIAALTQQAKNLNIKNYDHVIFSYHSLPLKQIREACASEQKSHCYKDACYETSVHLAQSLGIKAEDYSTTFQSGLSKKWLSPFTADELKNLAKQGKKKVLVFTPSFVADCLETTVEIGMEYRDMFIEQGGESLDLVPCVNASDSWVEAILEIIQTQNSHTTSEALE